MPVSTSYPGIYIQELPSQSHTITPAPTSVTVFVGYTHPFKTNPSAPGVPTFDGQPIELFSFTDYERSFGGLYLSPSVDSNVAFAVQQFFLNGGSIAYVVGLQPLVFDPTNGTAALKTYYSPTATVPNSDMMFSALEPTDAANQTTIMFSNQKGPTTLPTVGSTQGPAGYNTADITITYGSRSEVFRGVSAGSVNTVLASSQLVAVSQASTPANASSTYPYGLFPPTAASNTSGPPPVAPAVATVSATLAYPPGVLAFPYSPITFALKSGVTPTATTPLTITFSNPTVYTAATGTTPSGYTHADVTITMGSTTEHYANVNNIVGDTNYILTRINTTPAPAPSALVTVALASGASGPGLFPPLGNSSTSTITSQSISFPLLGLTPCFEASDFTSVMQASMPLDKLGIFNLLVVPGITDAGVLGAAVAFAELKRAFVIMDPPALNAASSKNLLVEDIVQVATPAVGTAPLDTIPLSVNAALYFPYLVSPNPLSNVSGATIRLPPSGFVAGVFARTDQNRGVWKAPAGLETVLTNTTSVVPEGVMNDGQAGVLNLIGVNAIRTFPGQGTVVFGARTVLTANLSYLQWRYVPVRRMALFIEQTLFANLGWVIFEPNDVPLWNAIKSTVERFMLSLFRQGAFQGTTPSQAFLVKCDASTTTQDDIDNGRVNVLVGFAPLKPAEFVVIQITQLAGQASS